MWSDSKTVGILNFGSTVQKLLDIENFPFLHCSYGEITPVVTFQR